MFINMQWLARASVMALGIAAIDAWAQIDQVDSVPTQIGLAIASVPDYKGSDNYRGALVPLFRYTFDDGYRYVAWVGPQITLNLLSSSSFRLGPVANYQPARDDNVHDDVINKMNTLDSAVEGGVFGEMVFADEDNKRNRTILGATLLTTEGRSHAILNANWWHQVALEWDVLIGGSLDYGNSDYNNYYFGVNSDNVGTSGLPFFTADAGVNEYFLTLGAAWYINRDWMGVGALKLGQIAADAEDSPLVSGRGNQHQPILGIGLVYQWR